MEFSDRWIRRSTTRYSKIIPWCCRHCRIRFQMGSFFSSSFTFTILHLQSPKEGIFGLAFTALAVDNITPPIINAINQGLLDQPLFTTWFGQRGAPGTSASGAFTYGGLDKNHCGPVIGYAELTNARHFQFQVFLESFDFCIFSEFLGNRIFSWLICIHNHI